ncbi:MAG: hypothetical protein QOE17_1649, partial [Gaiellales bacterium]|nr:hypothetical protein [Gaiellales bacterium]
MIGMPDWEVTDMRIRRMARAGLGRPPDSEFQQLLATQLAVTHALHTAVAGGAVDAVLEQVCVGLEWELGVVWIEDSASRELVCGGLWQPPDEPLGSFAAAIREAGDSPVVAFAQAAWESRSTSWLAQDAAAAVPEVECGVAVAVVGGGHAIGVLGFFAGRRRDPDAGLGELIEGFGLQLGEAIARDEA